MNSPAIPASIRDTESDKHESVVPPGIDHSKYFIYSRLEIIAILELLRKSRSPLTAYFGGGGDFILTSIIAVMADEDRVVIDCGANSVSNRLALEAPEITFTAALDRIKIQFAVDALHALRFGGRDSFSMPLPTALLRLQRREYFRVTTPLTRPLKCVIAPPNAHVPAEFVIVDISCGGVGIVDTSSAIETGMRIADCRIALPELGAISTDMLIKSTFSLTFRSGAQHNRAGCEFVNLRERDRSLIQRYINKLQRERRSTR